MISTEQVLLNECFDIEDVVNLINSYSVFNSRDDGNVYAHTIAAVYAVNGAEEGGYGLGDAEIEAQLDALGEHGATFGFSDAMKEAKIRREHK